MPHLCVVILGVRESQITFILLANNTLSIECHNYTVVIMLTYSPRYQLCYQSIIR